MLYTIRPKDVRYYTEIPVKEDHPSFTNNEMDHIVLTCNLSDGRPIALDLTGSQYGWVQLW